jgi:hypothetical protein
MGEKKKKEVAQKKWKKVLFIILAVLFVVVMVVSSMGSNWITGLAPVKAGDPVVIDYTIYDTSGNPLLTSNQQLYEQQITSGKAILYTRNLSLTADQSLKTAIYPVQVYVASNGGSWEQFALYNPEYTAISSGVVGMRTNDKKKVAFNYSSSMSALFSSDDLMKANINISALEVGETLAMGVSESPNASASNTSAVTYIRLGEVTRKSPTGVVVDFGYPYAEITLASFTKQ